MTHVEIFGWTVLAMLLAATLLLSVTVITGVIRKKLRTRKQA